MELHINGQNRGQILIRLFVGCHQSGGGEQDVDALEFIWFELEKQSSQSSDDPRFTLARWHSYEYALLSILYET